MITVKTVKKSKFRAEIAPKSIKLPKKGLKSLKVGLKGGLEGVLASSP